MTSTPLPSPPPTTLQLTEALKEGVDGLDQALEAFDLARDFVKHLTRHSDDELIVFNAVAQLEEQPADHAWYWHRRDPGNHEIVCHGEAYTRKDDAIIGALRANPDLTSSRIQVTE